MAPYDVPDKLLPELTAFLNDCHHPAAAPEPLITLTSHFQLFRHILNTKKLFISLTNTSSRKTRQEIFLRTLQLLNLQPVTLFYQSPVIEVSSF
jgi:hypothetical protein